MSYTLYMSTHVETIDLDTCTDEELGIMFMKEYVRIEVLKESTSDWFLGILAEEINARVKRDG